MNAYFKGEIVRSSTLRPETEQGGTHSLFATAYDRQNIQTE